MADIPNLPVDVYFGDAEKPLPDWRAGLPDRDEEDEEDQRLVGPERAALVAMLGFDPDELEEERTAAGGTERAPFQKG